MKYKKGGERKKNVMEVFYGVMNQIKVKKEPIKSQDFLQNQRK